MARYDTVIMASTGKRRSSTFYRLEKPLSDGYKSVLEFHTVVNGNKYYVEHEELPDGHTGWRGKCRELLNAKQGNAIYSWYKESLGYKFAGIYEMDIYGYKKLLSENPIH